MTKLLRRKRNRRLTEAEGYIDLLLVFANRWAVESEARDRLAQRALDALAPLLDGAWRRAQVWFLQGQALRIMERYNEAAQALRKSIDLDPEVVQTYLALSWCHKRLKRLDLAIESLETALAIDPDKPILHYNLACYWSLAQNPKLSVKYLANAFDLDSQFRQLVDNESDFDPIRANPEFQLVTSLLV